MATSTFPSVQTDARQAVQQMFGYITAQGDTDYLGENVSQLQHSLQAATLAQQAGADDDTVLGALLHDVGRFIPAAEKDASMIDDDGVYVGKASHETVGERYLRQIGFNEKICQLVGAHVVAKRYLCAVDQEYYNTLKKGGPFTEEQVKDAQKDPWLQNKLQVRIWDDLAKEPNAKTPPLSSFQDMAVKSLIESRASFQLHGREYHLPDKPTVVVCIDGFDPEYLDHATAPTVMPTLTKFKREGWGAVAHCAMPSLTNPNNVSIITGAPTALHGISGNFFLDRETGKESMILDDSLMRGSTILAELQKRGVRVAAVTAKDKLRKILARGLGDAVCFSSEKGGNGGADIPDVEKWMGQPCPSQYSGELSVYVMDAGVKLLEEDRADVLYLTFSDYIQHKNAPGSPESDNFYREVDKRFAKLVELGAQIAVTGDHGMSDKSKSDGKPRVLFLEEALDARFGRQGTSRVICPITDPFVKHHGALGSFVRVYLKDKEDLKDALEFISSLPEVDIAMSGEEAAAKFEMPADREGDIAVVSKKNAVIGSRKEEHDLSQLGDHRLRSHGGLSEQQIPLLLSRPTKRETTAGRQWRNFDAFDLVLNY